jgi:acetyl esterase/lipase
MIHGGSWAHPYGMGDWPTIFANGDEYVVFEIGYRLNSDATWPAPRDDVHAAIAWARANSYRWGVDPSVIGLLGSSAGGHLAASANVSAPARIPLPGPFVQVGYDDTDPTHRTVAASVDNQRTLTVVPLIPEGVRCVVALSAPFDPQRAWRDGEHPTGTWAKDRAALRAEAEKLAGGRADNDPATADVWYDMAVRLHAAGAIDAPTLAIHFADDMVPVAHAEDLHTAEATQPDPGQVLVIELPGQGHGLTALTYPGVLGSVRAFLADHLATNQGPLPPRPDTPGDPSCPSIPEPGPSAPGGCCGGGSCGDPADSDSAPLPDPTFPPPCGGPGPAAPEPAPSGGCCGGAPCGGPGSSDPYPLPDPTVPPPPCIPEHTPCGGQGRCDGSPDQPDPTGACPGPGAPSCPSPDHCPDSPACPAPQPSPDPCGDGCGDRAPVACRSGE